MHKYLSGSYSYFQVTEMRHFQEPGDQKDTKKKCINRIAWGGKKSGKAHIQVDALLKIPLQTNSITTHTNTLKFLFSLHTGTILPVCTLKLSTITFFTTQNKFLSQALAQSPHLHPPHSQAFLDLHKLTI